MSTHKQSKNSEVLDEKFINKIAEEIGSGTNEGEILDMQISNELDPNQPHLYWHPELKE
jgi:hypothetical protein